MATPLPCNTNLIQFVGDPTVWYNINVVTGKATMYGELNPQHYVNAIGFNPLDNFIYGYDITVDQVVQVDADRNITLLGRPTGMPANGYNTGCFDSNGFFYVILNNTARFYTIDLRPGSSSYMRLVDPLNGYAPQTANYGTAIVGGNMNVSDWSADSNGFLYGIQSNGVMQRLNLANAHVINMVTSGPNPGASFGAIAIDKNNIIYAIENQNGGVYRYTVDGTTATGTYFSSTFFDSHNDGTMCRNAEVLLDFGDAPDLGAGNGAGNYNTLLANNGPRHQIIDSLYFGYGVTSEGDAHQNADATGDDMAQGLQDDGLAVPLAPLSISASSYSLDVSVFNNTGATANMYAWVDFNKNGVFEPNEAVTTTVSSAGEQQVVTINFDIPSGITPGDTFVRLRVTTDTLDASVDAAGQDLRSIGAASDGEVEDYILTVSQIADLETIKSADKSTVLPGDILTFTLAVTNHGPDASGVITVLDNIPAQIRNVEYSLGSTTWQSPWTGSITLPELGMGESAEILIRGTVNFLASGDIVNMASVNSPVFDPDTANNTDIITIPVIASADLSILKTPTPEQAIPGEPVTYSIWVSNAGPSDAANTVLADSVPAVVQNPQVSFDQGDTWQDWSGTTNLGTVQSGEAVNVLIRGTLSTDAVGDIYNTASVTSDTPDPDIDNNSVTVEQSVLEDPEPWVPTSTDVSIAKDASPKPVVAGEEITYTLTVTNHGPSDAMDCIVTDAIPSVVLSPEYSLDSGATWQTWAGSCDIGTLAAGATQTIAICGTVGPGAIGTITNTALISTTTPDTDLSNNSQTDTTDVETSADVEIIKTLESEQELYPGDTIVYKITTINNGPSFARDVMITDPEPAWLTNPEFSLDAGNTWQPWTGSYPIGDMAAGAIRVAFARGIIATDAQGMVANTAVVGSTTSDPNPDNNTSMATTPLGDSANLSISKTASISATAGDMLTFTLAVTNSGPSDATNVVVQDDMPASILSPEYSTDNGTTWQPWSGSYNISTLEADKSADILVRGIVTSDTATSIPNIATVKSDTHAPDTSDNTANILVPVETSADIYVTKTAEPNPIEPLETLTYTIMVGNSGPSDAIYIEISDDIPTELSNAEFSLDNGDTWDEWDGSYVLANLPNGESVTLLIRGQVSADATGVITNTVIAHSQTPDPSLSNNSDTEITQIAEAALSADLSVTKTVSKTKAKVGDVLTYTITVQNGGPSQAQQVSLTDVLPTGLLNTKCSVDGGETWQPWEEWGSIISLGSIDMDETRTVLLHGTVGNDAIGNLTNVVFVTSQTPDPTPSNNYSTANTLVSCPPPMPPMPPVPPHNYCKDFMKMAFPTNDFSPPPKDEFMAKGLNKPKWY